VLLIAGRAMTTHLPSQSSPSGILCRACLRRVAFAFDGRCRRCAGIRACGECRSGMIVGGACDQCGKREEDR
jgi:hypothetical protein